MRFMGNAPVKDKRVNHYFRVAYTIISLFNSGG